MKKRYWIVIAIDMLLVYAVTWVPQINGPHLWFGLPSLFVWFCLTSSVTVTGSLLYFERTRDDLRKDDLKGEEVPQ